MWNPFNFAINVSRVMVGDLSFSDPDGVVIKTPGASVTGLYLYPLSLSDPRRLPPAAVTFVQGAPHCCRAPAAACTPHRL